MLRNPTKKEERLHLRVQLYLKDAVYCIWTQFQVAATVQRSVRQVRRGPVQQGKSSGAGLELKLTDIQGSCKCIPRPPPGPAAHTTTEAKTETGTETRRLEPVVTGGAKACINVTYILGLGLWS